MDIYNERSVFSFDKLSLGNPGRLQGGSYFSKISYDNKPFYIQTSKCDTKNGIITTGKKTYCDLMFTGTNAFLEIMERVEERIKEILFEKSDIWFNESLDLDDIEYFFNSPIRNYKSQYQLLRTYVNQKINSLNVYDENKTLKQVDDISKNIICVINLKGIKFTSQSVHLDIELKQVMILDNYEDKTNFNECLIQNVRKRSTQRDTTISEDTHANREEPIQETIEDTNGDEIKSSIETGTDVLANNEELKSIDTPTPIASLVENVGSIETSKIYSSQLSEKRDEKTDVEVIDTIDEVDTIQETSNNTITNKVESNVEPENNITNDATTLQYETSNDEDNIQQDLEETINLDIRSKHSTNDTNKINENNETTPTKNTYDLEEITLEIGDDEPLELKKPNEVYYEIYRIAREKAKQAKQAAIIAYLEAKNIKNTYMLEVESDSESDDEYLDDLENMSVSSITSETSITNETLKRV